MNVTDIIFTMSYVLNKTSLSIRFFLIFYGVGGYAATILLLKRNIFASQFNETLGHLQKQS
jgi:hypothetical protein